MALLAGGLTRQHLPLPHSLLKGGELETGVSTGYTSGLNAMQETGLHTMTPDECNEHNRAHLQGWLIIRPFRRLDRERLLLSGLPRHFSCLSHRARQAKHNKPGYA